MNTRAQWVEGIPDLYEDDRLAEAGNYLTVAQVSKITGLSPNTITNALSRPKITSETNPLGPICRPDVRIGSRPLYGHQQAEQAKQRRVALGDRKHFGGQGQPLPSVTFEEALRSEMVSTVEIAEKAGVHEQTVRGWARSMADFPAPVALRDRHPDEPKGAPSVVYELGPVTKWLARQQAAKTG